ncbi:YggS family pyridoxal phosphate enzyme [Candidatus Velamenicoccus archaeovorus]|uniref:Pyridoxal phosphate homeostasis protein n=1 Tax=Velamenicoccus archaeovorus TaxID=1930593 RepID=A0A410P5B1_VELA1|nr:YggS family pyridoxal phosphate-dependent enzyme [Candidatus Velamenicoccus archaeovorus]QAT17261.1 YggS family pyridoxal phosphate enzyme [Candidatus Velamenicoccus archaeovorus]
MIRENISEVKERIIRAAQRAATDPSEITLVAVTKNVSVEDMCRAVDAGTTHIGESRVQEALSKYDHVRAYASARGIALVWHMIGHLQTNKTREAVRLFDLIHSVDSVRLARQIDKQAAAIGKVQNVLMEVKTSPEAAKYGFMPDDVAGALKEMASLDHLSVKGLMTVAPAVHDPGEARPYFRTLKELLIRVNELRVTNYELRILSMGMTDDFEAAVEEGATLVRVGRGIFGGRKER